MHVLFTWWEMALIAFTGAHRCIWQVTEPRWQRAAFIGSFRGKMTSTARRKRAGNTTPRSQLGSNWGFADPDSRLVIPPAQGLNTSLFREEHSLSIIKSVGSSESYYNEIYVGSDSTRPWLQARIKAFVHVTNTWIFHYRSFGHGVLKPLCIK